MSEELKDTWFNEIRLRLALWVARLYQVTGANGFPEFILDLLYWVQRKLDPTSSEDPELMNWVLLESIRERIGVSEEKWNSDLDKIHRESEREAAGLPVDWDESRKDV